jgi:hypothetical protein
VTKKATKEVFPPSNFRKPQYPWSKFIDQGGEKRLCNEFLTAIYAPTKLLMAGIRVASAEPVLSKAALWLTKRCVG